MKFPHIKFMALFDDMEKDLYYLGETNDKFTRGKLYKVRNSLYSENEDDPRMKALIANSDGGKIIIVNKMEFGTLSELRELRIKEFLDDDE